jgi:uncharacterized membrane protein YphA (DoxX/SURF4 family)
MTGMTPKPFWARIMPWIWTVLAVGVALFFIRAAWEKLVGMPSALAPFREFGWPLWMATATAAAEILGAVALVIPKVRHVGGLLLTAIMVGAAFTNIANGHPEYLWVNVVLACASLLLAWHAQRQRWRLRNGI